MLMSYSGVQSSATVPLRGDGTDGITGRNIVFLRLIIIRLCIVQLWSGREWDYWVCVKSQRGEKRERLSAREKGKL